MLNPEAMAVIYGLGSAVAWGAGDFSGGLATKRGGVLTVIFCSQLIGLVMLLTLQFAWIGQSFHWRYGLWGGLAGIGGTFGLVALYKGLATGRMGVVAPVSAVVTALIPIGFAFMAQGLPKGTQILGFGSALVAVWLFSATRDSAAMESSELGLALLAGMGFGLFFICIDRVSEDAVLWPLIAARTTSIVLLAVILGARRRPFLPSRGQFVLVLLTGILDTAGNACFALASGAGRLDVAAVLASMYPASTVLLARCLLNERLHRQQQFGLLTAFAALALIAL